MKLTRKLQTTISEVHCLYAKWLMKLNEIKSMHIHFTNRIIVNIRNRFISYENTAIYNGASFDAKLMEESHIKKTKKNKIEIQKNVLNFDTANA